MRKLNCFSPPVMLTTLSIEGALTIYTLWRYKLDDMIRLSAITLVCLAGFQLAEYNVCTGYGSHAEAWSKVGFVLITALPPLGIHLLHKIAGISRGYILNGAYITMAGFMLLFLTYRSAFVGHQCTGNYVIFQLGNTLGNLYEFYYYGWLLTAIMMGLKWMNDHNSIKRLERNVQAMKGLILGYLVFLIPTAVAYSVKPQARAAVPSVMCGFAVLFAMILVFYIVPRMTFVKEVSSINFRKA